MFYPVIFRLPVNSVQRLMLNYSLLYLLLQLDSLKFANMNEHYVILKSYNSVKAFKSSNE